MGFLVPLAAPLVGMFGGAAAAGAGAATTASVASTVLAATGAVLGGVGEMTAANYRAKVAKNNALISERNAELAATEGAYQESQQRYKTSKLVGAQKAAQAANGVDVAFGSPAAVRAESQAMGDLDALTLRYNSQKESQAYHSRAADARAEASMEKLAGKFALAKSFIGASNSIARGAGEYYDIKKRYKDVGVK